MDEIDDLGKVFVLLSGIAQTLKVLSNADDGFGDALGMLADETDSVCEMVDQIILKERQKKNDGN